MLRRPLLIASCAAGLVGPARSVPFDSTLVDYPLGVVDFANIPDIAAAGGRWIRVPAEWHHIEPADDQFNWQSGLTQWISEAAAAGVNVSPVVSMGMTWATGFPGQATTWPSYPPIDLQETWDPEHGYSALYYDFVSSFLIEYQDRIDRITIENEINTQNFWRGTMDDYRRVLATARKARDDVAPGVLVLDSGLGSGSWGITIASRMIETGEPPAEIVRFTNEWYQDDVFAPLHFNDYQDLVYWISQPFVQENIARVNYVVATVPEYADGLNLKFTGRHWLLPLLIDFIDARAAEFGYTLPFKVNNEASNWPLGSATEEGQNLFKLIISCLSKGISQALWFPWSNQQTSTPRKGLLDANGAQTPQYHAYVNIGDRLGSDFHFISHEILGADVMRYRFQREDESMPRIDALWWDDGNHGAGSEQVTVSLPPETIAVRRYTYDGVVSTVPFSGNAVTVTIDEEGTFLEYVTPQVGVEPGATMDVTDLLQNAPNPFRPSTTIGFRIPGSNAGERPFRLEIYDPAGRRVRVLAEGARVPGWYSATWDGRDDAGRPVAAGSFWYRLVTPQGVSAKRMLRLE